MVIQHNMMAANAQRQFNINGISRAKTVEKLSSGYRINRAADDAVGLAISEKMRRQIRGLSQASRNVQDGISFCQVADGALHEVHDMLQRMNELAVKAANGTNSAQDRKYMDEEVTHLKDEMSRVFETTEFNELKIFKAIYVPSIKGHCDDFQLFNTSSGIGGVLANNTRYTWKELGIDMNKDVYTDSNNVLRFTRDKKYELTMSNGETLELQATKGTKLDEISRIYRWSADSEGITINNNSAEKISWGSMGINSAGHVSSGKYEFTYHGMDISFEIPMGDSTIGRVIEGINGENALSETYWHTRPSGAANYKAVDLTNTTPIGVSQAVSSTNASAWFSTGLSIVADDDGITLKSSDSSASYKFVKWEDITKTDGSTPDYPIIDWGETDDVTSKTLDNSETYYYKDDLTGIAFSFRIADEASRDQVKAGLNDVGISRYFYTDMNSTSTVSNGDVSIEFSQADLSFSFSNILQDDGTAKAMGKPINWDTDLSMKRNANDTFTINLDYKGATHTASYETTISYAEMSKLVKNGQLVNFWRPTLTNASELKGYYTSAENSEHLKGINSVDNDLYLNVKSSKVKNDYDTKVATLSSDLALGNINQAQYDAGVKQALEDGITEILDFFNDPSADPAFKTNKVWPASVSFDERNSITTSVQFSMVVEAPKKQLPIQAGAEAGQHIVMEWSPLNLSILGFTHTDLITAECAEATISDVKYAMGVISEERSAFGAYQNRMEHTQKNLDNIVENTTAAESRIRDADMAKESVRLAILNILNDAGYSMISQANQSKQGILSLLS